MMNTSYSPSPEPQPQPVLSSLSQGEIEKTLAQAEIKVSVDQEKQVGIIEVNGRKFAVQLVNVNNGTSLDSTTLERIANRVAYMLVYSNLLNKEEKFEGATINRQGIQLKDRTINHEGALKDAYEQLDSMLTQTGSQSPTTPTTIAVQHQETEADKWVQSLERQGLIVPGQLEAMKKYGTSKVMVNGVFSPARVKELEEAEKGQKKGAHKPFPLARIGNSITGFFNRSKRMSKADEPQPQAEIRSAPKGEIKRPEIKIKKPEVQTNKQEQTKGAESVEKQHFNLDELDKAGRTQLSVMKEIAQTEASYLDGLVEVKDRIDRMLSSTKHPEKYPVMKEMQGRYQVMIDRSTKLHEQLVKILNESSSIDEATAQCHGLFSSKDFKAYVEDLTFCALKLEDLAKEDKDIQKDPKCAGIEKNAIQKANAEGKGALAMANMSFFITPIQRGPRFRLLQAELLKNTPANAAGYETGKTSQETIKNLLENVNEAKRQAEKESLEKFSATVTGQITVKNKDEFIDTLRSAVIGKPTARAIFGKKQKFNFSEINPNNLNTFFEAVNKNATLSIEEKKKALTQLKTILEEEKGSFSLSQKNILSNLVTIIDDFLNPPPPADSQTVTEK
ncbi:RhoGEF domain-containing protein [Candidatus Protochlamydia phocaeensis]|uniref:RhoGEF domain-containing protein n=1 Tax=Candidatus Protochlamydia phocaeensis TaxID=1414722 RepID=UPI00083899E4|nr:RhoGEF domain-containing protein [Candidatus Protochlamydia phocaeensis]